MTNCLYPFQRLFSHNVYVTVGLITLIILSVLLLRINNSQKMVRYTKYLSLVLLWTGAIGNLYQRVQYVCVMDNLNFFGLFKFNLYDILVTTGIVLALIVIFIGDRKQG